MNELSFEPLVVNTNTSPITFSAFGSDLVLTNSTDSNLFYFFEIKTVKSSSPSYTSNAFSQTGGDGSMVGVVTANFLPNQLGYTGYIYMPADSTLTLTWAVTVNSTSNSFQTNFNLYGDLP